jgi:diguanylate cyclase (GGDEF)-like protein
MSKASDPTAGELVPLAERLRVMQAFRLGVGLFVVLLSEVLHVPLLVAPAELMAATVAYLVVLVLAQAAWQLAKRRGLLLFGLMLIADGAYLAWAAHATGGASSPLRLVVMLHLIAVALLASHRTSLKLALWHSLLLFVVHYAQEGGVLQQAPQSGTGLSPTAHLAVFVTLFWLVAVGTSTLSAVNERELRRRRYDLEALAAMARALDNATTVDGVAKVLLDSVVDTFGLGRSLLLTVRENGEFAFAASAGAELSGVQRHTAGPASVLTAACRSHESHLVAALDPVVDRWLDTALPAARNLVIVPLQAEGRTIAVLVCEHGLRSGSRIERRVVSMLERFASHGALALSNTQLVERLQRVADTDGLTGIANRRSFDRELAREVATAARSGRPLGLVLIDIDHFKRLNDEHGHQLGDEMLRRVAAVLAGSLRATDTVARYGGEEFVVLLPECTAGEALVRADDLRRAIETADVPVTVTVSGGVAEYPLQASSAAELVRLADEALYVSKRDGRNRMTVTGARPATVPLTTAPTTAQPA